MPKPEGSSIYHPEIVASRVAAAERLLKQPLRRYTPGETEEFLAALRLHEKEGEEVDLRSLPPELLAFIQNEQRLCRVDFRYWTKYARLKTDKGRVEAFNLWPSQEYFLSKLAAEEKRQWEAWQGRGGAEQFAFKGRFIWVKSRQVGGTRLAQMVNIHIALTFPNTYSLVASDTPEKGLELWRLVDTAYSGLPFFLRPGRVGRVKGSEHFFEGLGSTIVIGAGNQKASFGQGVTVDSFHCSEASTWLPEVAALIDTDLFWAFDSSRKLYSIGMIESTAQGGTGNWFGQQWEQSVKGRSLFIPIFLGWFMTPEKWRLDDPRIVIRPETEALGKRITERFPEFTPDKAQLAWYQTRRDEMASKGKLGEFLEEVPSFPEEAFEHGVQSIFSIETRDRVRAGVRKPPVVKRWEEGEAVKAEWDGDPEGADDLILFWEPPERGGVYVVAVDGAHGKETGDSHAIEVLKAGEKVEQVAEWTHRGGGLLGLGRVAEIASYLGYLYRNQAEDRPAVIAPESNPGSPSAYVTLKLLEEGYPNIYIHRRAAKIRGEQLKEDVGWQTNEATRSPLVSKGKEAVEGGSLVIRSERALEELRHFTRVWSPGGRVKFEHAPGKHDDALIALFIGNWVATDDLVRVEASEAERADLALARKEKGVEGGGFRIMLGIPPAERWEPPGVKTNIWGDVW